MIPASGFYEWRVEPGGKRPYVIRPAGGGLLTFAGLSERWVSPEGTPLGSCTIVTTTPNAVVAPIHPERMPVLLAPEQYATWLGEISASLEEIHALCRPAPDDWLVAEPANPEMFRRKGD